MYPDLLVRDSSAFVLVKIFCGTLAVVGHLFPVFAGFRGGKGVATMFGMVIGLHPAAAGVSLLGFVVTYAISSFVSLSSMVASLVFVLAVIILFQEDRTAMVVFAILQLVLIIFTHRKNIGRLRNGNETAIKIFSKTRSLS